MVEMVTMIQMPNDPMEMTVLGRAPTDTGIQGRVLRLLEDKICWTIGIIHFIDRMPMGMDM